MKGCPYYSFRKISKQFLKSKRKEYGLTQVDLSDKSGGGLRFVRELEQGKPTLRLDKINQVLALFGVEMAPAKIQPSDTSTPGVSVY